MVPMVVSVCLPRIEQPLPYLVPEKWRERIRLFQRVTCEVRDEKQTGLVTGIAEGDAWREQFPNLNPSDLKTIHRLVDANPIMNREQWDLAAEVSRYYGSTVGEAAFSMFPSGRRETGSGELNTMLESPFLDGLPPLLPEQAAIAAEILRRPEGTSPVHLLHGITGSGKTRIYLELIENYLRRSEGCLFLLPEIALSYQFLDQLKPLFGSRLALLHSGLPRSVRLREYLRVMSGDAQLVVGTRSAIFAPIKSLSLIILDEEHDSSYKEHSAPRYHCRRIAQIRLQGRPNGALILGSATPSLESYYLARAGRIHYHSLQQRATGMKLPTIHVEKHDTGDDSRHIFSLHLKDRMTDHLNRGNQVLLLLNRRGYSHYAFCPRCELTIGCPHCSVSLTHHRSETEEPELICHLCDHRQTYSGRCPDCSGPLKLRGKGTQKIDEAMEKIFPGVVYARLDQDTARVKEYSREIISDMKNGKIQVLIGTQMIAKGFDIPGVTLVGLINADVGLNLPDFRAPERVFQLLIQSAGRSGRHSPGEVVIQTQMPHHFAIHNAATQNYEAFATRELAIRREMQFPPFLRLFRLVIVAATEQDWAVCERHLQQHLSRYRVEEGLFEALPGPAMIHGPMEAPITRIKDKFRYHLLARDSSSAKLTIFATELARFCRRFEGQLRFEFDMDPQDLL